MKVKKFIAATMPEAMQQIRKELGKEAVILNSKEVSKGGVFGLFKKKKLEVVAALDPNPIPDKEKPVVPVYEALPKKEALQQNVRTDKVLEEVQQLKLMVARQSNTVHFPGKFQNAYLHLLDQEVDEAYAKELVEAAIATTDTAGALEIEEVAQCVADVIEKRLSGISFNGINVDEQVTYLVGPTGVGKTTTIAKLAAKNMLEADKEVALITADTYRIAAIDQLKTYAKILNIPVEVVYSKDDFQEAVQKFAQKDMIFIDTAGRNFREHRYIEEMKENIAIHPNANILLVLPLNGKQKDLKAVIEQFLPIQIQSFLFTKLDETASYGAMLNIMLTYGIGISYIANGQDVPDDLIQPTANMISEYIVGGMKDA